MTETLRIESVIDAVQAIIKQSNGSISQRDLVAKVQRKLPGNVRIGDVRAAIWQLVDGGQAEFTVERKIKKRSPTRTS